MKLFKKTLVAFIILTALFGCEKEKEKPPCVGPVKVQFQNRRAYPVRMEMATAFDAQDNPINPLFVIELPAYGTERREYPSGIRYKTKWKRNCATTCVVEAGGDTADYPCADVTETN
jgi:hypothetical protein